MPPIVLQSIVGFGYDKSIIRQGKKTRFTCNKSLVRQRKKPGLGILTILYSSLSEFLVSLDEGLYIGFVSSNVVESGFSYNLFATLWAAIVHHGHIWRGAFLQ